MGNDITIAGSIMFILIIIGVMLPFVQAEFNQPVTNNDVSGLSSQIGDDIRNVRDNETVTGILGTFNTGAKTISFFDVFFSVVGMFFWTFGALPFWIDIFFVFIRIILALIIARNVWIGGGG